MSIDIQQRKLPVVAPASESSTSVALQTMGEDVELRTSNEVEGFRYSRGKAIFYAFSTLFQIPFLPLWPFFIARQVKDPSYAKHYFRTLAYCLKVIVDQIRFGSFVRMLRYNVVMKPSEVEERIASRQGACSRCAKCCQQFDCIFLGKDEQEDYFCKVYKTDYWFYGTCGRFPLDQRDIDFHACPGFSFENEAA